MKKILVPAIVCAMTFLASCNNKPATEEAKIEASAPEVTYTLNADSTSFVNWKGVMLGVKEHSGKVSFKDGGLTTAGGVLKSGNFTIDLTTITPLDSAYDAKSGSTKEKLVGHLSSPDFFDVANHPTASFKIDSVSGNTATGTLTVRGKSNTETLTDIVITENETGLKASGKLTFDRKKYDVAFDMPVKDLVLSNDIQLSIEINATKK